MFRWWLLKKLLGNRVYPILDGLEMYIENQVDDIHEDEQPLRKQRCDALSRVVAMYVLLGGERNYNPYDIA